MQQVRKKRFVLPSKLTSGLIALAVVIAVVGAGTMMWFAGSDNVKNAMALGRQSVIVTESFKPIDNMYPGDTVTKDVTFTNEGDMKSLFRVKYSEYWTASNGNTLSNTFWDASSSSVLDVMIKNWNSSGGFSNTTLWTDGGDGYYYYNKVLDSGETTDPVLDSLKLNERLLTSGVMIDYTKAQYNLDFSVDSISVSADDASIKGHFGSYVGVTVASNGTVTWTFS